MNLFRRVTLLGLFASVGVGLAVCVGYSTPASTNAEVAQPPPEKPDTAKPDGVEPVADVAEPPLSAVPQPADAPQSTSAPMTPVVVMPYPARAALAVPSAALPGGQVVGAPAPGGLAPPPVPVPQVPGSDRAGPLTSEADGASRPSGKATVNREQDGLFSIDLQDADLRDVLFALGEEGNLNILINDKVTGTVSASLKDVDIQGALDAILESKGYVARRQGKFVMVGTQADFAEPTDELGNRVYHPQHVSATVLKGFLEQFLTPQVGTISLWKPAETAEPAPMPPGTDTAPGTDTPPGTDTAPGNEFLIVKDYESVLTEIDQYVAKLDVAPAGAQAAATPSRSILVDPIEGEGDDKLSIDARNSRLGDVLEVLREQGDLNIIAGSEVLNTTVYATLTDVDVDTALDAILRPTGFVARREGKFVYIGKPADFDSFEQNADRIGTRIYRPNYVTAAELESLISKLLTQNVGVVSVSTPAEVGIADDNTNAGGDAFAGADVLLVRDYETVLRQIDQVVDEVDVRPMQVAIEAMVLSVKLDDSDKFGVNFELLRDKPNVRLGWGTPLTSVASVDFTKGGLKFGFLDGSLSAFLEALETIGDTNVIATPRLMVLNKHRAEIQIGEKKGYVSTTVTETSSTQSVEFLDIGALLRLRPFISSDGMIRMEVHPELSDGSVDTESGFTLPNKEVTEVTTNIMVRDGCTVIIGGLMREQLTDTTTQVPVFGNLPLVGAAFRNKEEKIERREVLVLITPRIIYEPWTGQEGDKAATEFHRRHAVYQDQMSPLGKRAIARRYFRLAQNAWAGGDRGRALRFVELAIHFDPLSRAAIELRTDIFESDPQGDHSLAGESVPTAAAGPMDGPAIAPWLLDDLGESDPPAHPLDRGRPGSRTDVDRPRRFQ